MIPVLRKVGLAALLGLGLMLASDADAVTYRCLNLGATSTNAPASFAPGESGTLTEGTPIQIVTYPQTGAGNDLHRVKVCPDGAKPDGVVTRVISNVTSGAIMYAAGDRVPALAGAAIAKGAKLKVASGKFVTATTGNVYYLIAREAAAAANDIIPVYYTEGTVP